jgi:hypothetical protein
MRTASQLMFFMPNRVVIDCQSVSLFLGGVGPRSFHLVFCYALVKIYLGKLYTIGKLSSSSICRYYNILRYVYLAVSYVFSGRQNSVYCVVFHFPMEKHIAP